MSAIEPLYNLIKIKSRKFSKEEMTILEAELFVRIYKELMEIFRKEYREYFMLMKFSHKEVNLMLETNFARLILQDIILSEHYSLMGIARYTNTPEDVVQEIIDGRNTNPSARFLRQIIELHRRIRTELYQTIFNKVTSIK